MKRISNIKSIIKKALLYALLFYVIYTPSLPNTILIDKNISIPLVTIVLLGVNAFEKKKNNLLSKSSLYFTIFLSISSVYCLLVYLVSNSQPNLVNSRIVQNCIPICYLIIVSILFKYLHRKKTFKTLMTPLYNLAAFQGIICVLMLFSESLHNIALTLYGVDNIFITSTRIFGISSDYTFATPIYHGLIAALLLRDVIRSKSIKAEKIIGLIKFTLIMLTIILNGRTGLVVFVACSIFIGIKYLIDSKKILYILKLVTAVGVILYILINSLKIISPNTYIFIDSFVKDTWKVATSNETDGNYAILKDSVTFPKGEKLIFGEGLRVYGDNADELGYTRSDIGYVNDLYLGGIIYAFLLYSSYLYLILKKIDDKDKRFVLVTTLLLGNFKGEIFRAGIVIFGIICVCIVNELERMDYEHSS